MKETETTVGQWSVAKKNPECIIVIYAAKGKRYRVSNLKGGTVVVWDGGVKGVNQLNPGCSIDLILVSSIGVRLTDGDAAQGTFDNLD